MRFYIMRVTQALTLKDQDLEQLRDLCNPTRSLRSYLVQSLQPHQRTRQRALNAFILKLNYKLHCLIYMRTLNNRSAPQRSPRSAGIDFTESSRWPHFLLWGTRIPTEPLKRRGEDTREMALILTCIDILPSKRQRIYRRYSTLLIAVKVQQTCLGLSTVMM